MSSLYAQIDTRGTDFLLSFGANVTASPSAVTLQIRIVAEEAANCTITFNDITGAGRVVNINVAANTAETYTLSLAEKTASYTLTTETNNRSVRIQSDVPVSAYALNTYAALADATNILPIPILGDDYYHLGRNNGAGPDQYVVVAAQNNTIVYENGTQVATLMEGQVYFKRAASTAIDLSGYHITSNNPIAYFSSHSYCNISGGGDNFFQQFTPVNTWGFNFMVPVTRRGIELIRIVASENGTVIKQTGARINASTPAPATYTLNAGQWVEWEVTLANNGCYIQADKPVQVCSYMVGINYSGALVADGDESLVLIPPIEQSSRAALVAPFSVSTLTSHYVLIVTPTATKSSTTVSIGGAAPVLVSGGTWYDNANSGMSFYNMEVANNNLINYIFDNQSGLVVYGYGFGNYISYYYMAASAARQLNPAFYINDIHYQDADGQTYCDGPFEIRGVATMQLSPVPGFLKWYIDGVENISARDQFLWTIPSLSLNTPHEIKMVITDVSNQITTLTSTITVIDPVPLQISGTPYICPPATSTVLTATSGPSYYQWYKNGTAILGAIQSTYTITTANIGSYTVVGHYGDCATPMSNAVVVTLGCGAEAVPDTASVLKNKQVLIDVLANDDIPSACLGVIPSFTQPVNGTASISGDKILYIPNTDYIGKDSLEYSFICNSMTFTAKVRIVVHEMPDNIVDDDLCYVTTPSFNFTIKQQWSSAGSHHMTGPLVGDLNGDGLPEIVAYNSALNGISVRNGQTGDIITTISTGTAMTSSGGWHPVMTAVIVDADKNGRGELIIAHYSDNHMISYEATPSGNTFTMNQKWKTTHAFQNPTAADRYPHPIVADLNGDGVPELIVYNKIYNAATGAYLGETEPIASAYVGRAANRGGNAASNFIAVADFDGDGSQEIAAGGKVYKVLFNSNGTVSCSIWRQNASVIDGFTAVADVDLDGELDIVAVNVVGGVTRINVWTPSTNTLIDQFNVANSTTYQSYPFVGDIDGETNSVADRYPEICVVTVSRVNAFKYNPSTKKYGPKWVLSTTDTSGGTGITLFDFNNDGVSELVYRDETQLRILNGKGTTADSIPGGTFACTSGTSFEYPVIADTDGDGSANICVTCGSNIVVYESASTPWAPTRKVWNQVNYDIVQINEDLTVPSFPIPKNTVFNGKYPYNGALIQVPTMVNTDFSIVALAADPGVDSLWIEQINPTTMRLFVKITNHGVMFTNQSLPVALYGITPPPATAGGANFITYKPIGTGIAPHGGTDTIYFDVPYAGTPISFSVRIQDNGIKYPADGPYLDCDYNNNTKSINNPFINLLMMKDATLNSVSHRGTYPNPVSVLYNENIEYKITAVNANLSPNTTVIIRDTLPPYLNFVSSPATPPVTTGTAPGTPARTTLQWSIPNLASMATTSVSFVATPQSGAVASQPLFINDAWITVSDSITVPTNSTFHQGAGVSITTFSAGLGGQIYNAKEQALDYMTSPSSGIVIVPDEGYIFAGWSHDNYTSLRGKTIEAKSGITHYDTLTIYGNVELRANFELEKYPIEYYLNGGTNTATNPATYNIESGNITLDAPEKAGDVFVGWTGSNGEKPQRAVTISKGSIGELEYYANFLNSGREDDIQKQDVEEDKIWATKDELYIRTSKAGSIVRIYSTEGVLQKLHTIVTAGESKVKLSKGIYVVTLNNNAGQIVRIE